MKILVRIKKCLLLGIALLSEMRDEVGNITMEEFVGLKPKMYSCLVDDNSEHKKAKGVNKNVERLTPSNTKMFC